MSAAPLRAGAARRFEVIGGRALVGRVRVPGDKSLSHRALLLAALAEGESHLVGLSDGDDVVRTARAVGALGASVDRDRVRGGRDRLHHPAGPVDLGNSGTGMRLLAGVVAGYPWQTELCGDQSLSARPMDRIAEPLARMGATVRGRGEQCRPPLVIEGAPLTAVDYTVPMASAQVKSCVLLAGLRAEGETVVREAVLTRVHTEELLRRCGADIAESGDGGSHGPHVVRVRPSTLHAFELDVPGDPSQAAFWVVAGTIVAGSVITLPRVYVGPARRGFLEVLRRMGADIVETAATGPGDLAATAGLTVRAAPLVATDVEAAEIPSLDEVPVLAVAAAVAEGTTVFHDVGELRVKESDRLRAVAALARAFGAGAEVAGDDLVVQGVARLRPGAVDAQGDHRIAMAAAVAALAAGPEPSRVGGWEAVATSYPAFARDLAALQQGTDAGSGAAGPEAGER
jgi:3-phosphoshikimate 1-carboxyvinyltransferase